MPLPSGIRHFGTQKVTIVHNPGTEDETRSEVEAHIQAKAGFFAVETPIYEGDIVEFPDPRGGVDRRLVTNVDINNPTGPSMRHMAHTHVEFGKAPTPRVAPVRRLSIENLHPEVIRVAADLFADGHYEAAVGDAVKGLDVRVRDLIGSSQSGTKLMGEAFGGPQPRIDLSDSSGQTGKDEQEGFQAIFRGVMLAIRNPRMHELLDNQDPQVALEYLGLISLLHRRLDGRTV